MKFGAVKSLEGIDLTLPKIDLAFKAETSEPFLARVGLPQWNRNDIKHFYPQGTRDELTYYSTQFNSIELNATFFRVFPKSVFDKWYQSTPSDFIFFPKIIREISHLRKIQDYEELIDETVVATSNLKEKLGMTFLQMHDGFRPTDEHFDRLAGFIDYWKGKTAKPLALEARHTEWHNDPDSAKRYYDLMEANGVTNVITDTPGRRDVLHMQLTTPVAYVRYVGANDPTDYARLDDWVEQIAKWKGQGLQELDFIVHQNPSTNVAAIARYFVEKLNARIGTNLAVPTILTRPVRADGALFG